MHLTDITRSPPTNAILLKKCFGCLLLVLIVAGTDQLGANDNLASCIWLVVHSVASFVPVL